MQLHKIDGYIQTILLAEYPDDLVLLDGCCRADIPMIRRYIVEKLSRSFTDLSLVVVTHMHPDHAGAAHKLRRLTGCKIATANVPGQWYKGIDGILMHATDMFLARWVAKRMNKPRRSLWYSRKLYADYYINDGENLPKFHDWQIVFTQGHTDRDISLYHIPTAQLYVADLIVKVKNRFIPPFPVFYPNRYKASLKKVESLRAKTLILAHGGEVSLTSEDFQHLYNLAPKLPMTHWRSIKTKLLKGTFKR